MVRGAVQGSSVTWLLLTAAVVALLKKDVFQKCYVSHLNHILYHPLGKQANPLFQWRPNNGLFILNSDLSVGDRPDSSGPPCAVGQI